MQSMDTMSMFMWMWYMDRYAGRDRGDEKSNEEFSFSKGLECAKEIVSLVSKGTPSSSDEIKELREKYEELSEKYHEEQLENLKKDYAARFDELKSKIMSPEETLRDFKDKMDLLRELGYMRDGDSVDEKLETRKTAIREISSVAREFIDKVGAPAVQEFAKFTQRLYPSYPETPRSEEEKLETYRRLFEQLDRVEVEQ